ncbi:hypothetical protein CDAR_224091 [Caerostris darwini]|uniref:Uncharacterized protein n=1 Tax=Caerostris darwini TaxID=1538125 RepID=A0AAV4WLT2_9ARAC|nr:hypothetical protein CDAR_224091 [Caerostris darwini]
MIPVKVLFLLAVVVIANCSTVPEQASSQSPADPSTANPVSVDSGETTRKPHTHEEHPVDDPDHSDHPGHENDAAPSIKPKHHEGDHDHSTDDKVDDGHDHSQHDQEIKDQEEKVKPTKVEEVKDTDNDTQESRFKRGLWRRRLD